MGKPPVIMTGTSGSGKTFMLIDAVYEVAERATKIIIVTDSYETKENAYLRQHIPKAIVREFNIKNILEIWNNIITTQDFYSSNTQPAIIDAFVRKHAVNRPGFSQMHANIHNMKNQLAEIWQGDKRKDFEAACETLLVDANIKFIANNFWEGYPGLTEQDKMIVRACRSTKPFPVIFFDDVTARLTALKAIKDKVSVPIINEGITEHVEMSQTDATTQLFIDMMTRGRQYCVIAFFIHNFSTFASHIRQLVGPVVISTQQEAAEFARIRTFSSSAKQRVHPLYTTVRQEDEHNKLVFFPNLAFSPTDTEFAYIKAKPHPIPSPLGCRTYKTLLTELMRKIEEYKKTSADHQVYEQQQQHRSAIMSEFV